jgi:hypothetical protein
VQVADVRHAPHHGLAVELEHQPQHAVRRRVLRADVDEHVLALELGLERRRRLERHGLPAVVDHERHALRPPVGPDPVRRERHLDGALGRRHASPPLLGPGVLGRAALRPAPRRARMSAGSCANASATVISSIE